MRKTNRGLSLPLALLAAACIGSATAASPVTFAVCGDSEQQSGAFSGGLGAGSGAGDRGSQAAPEIAPGLARGGLALLLGGTLVLLGARRARRSEAHG